MVLSPLTSVDVTRVLPPSSVIFPVFDSSWNHFFLQLYPKVQRPIPHILYLGELKEGVFKKSVEMEREIRKIHSPEKLPRNSSLFLLSIVDPVYLKFFFNSLRWPLGTRLKTFTILKENKVLHGVNLFISGKSLSWEFFNISTLYYWLMSPFSKFSWCYYSAECMSLVG